MDLINRDQSPWCSRTEAATYLGEDPETTDAKLTDSEKFVPGMIRYRLLKDGSRRNKVRLWKADVLAMLPPFDLDGPNC